MCVLYVLYQIYFYDEELLMMTLIIALVPKKKQHTCEAAALIKHDVCNSWRQVHHTSIINVMATPACRSYLQDSTATPSSRQVRALRACFFFPTGVILNFFVKRRNRDGWQDRKKSSRSGVGKSLGGLSSCCQLHRDRNGTKKAAYIETPLLLRCLVGNPPSVPYSTEANP